MKRRSRINYTDSLKAVMWERWQKGDSMRDIARLFDRSHPAIQRILTANGGIRPRQRSRSSHALTLAEREVISRGLATQLSMREIPFHTIDTDQCDSANVCGPLQTKSTVNVILMGPCELICCKKQTYQTICNEVLQGGSAL